MGKGGRLTEFLVGVRRTSIEARRYKAGWTRLSAGGRKNRVAALAAKSEAGSQGEIAGLGAASNDDGRGLDNRAVDATHHASEGSPLPPPISVDCWGPVVGLSREVMPWSVVKFEDGGSTDEISTTINIGARCNGGPCRGWQWRWWQLRWTMTTTTATATKTPAAVVDDGRQ